MENWHETVFKGGWSLTTLTELYYLYRWRHGLQFLKIPTYYNPQINLFQLQIFLPS